MNFLTGQKDTDIEILNRLDDKSLIKFCHSNTKTLNFCNTNQQFWLNRIIAKYKIPIDVLNKYKGDRTWSEYYIQDLRKIDKSVLKWLQYGSVAGRLDFVMAALNLGADINNQDSRSDHTALMFAVKSNHFEIVKYLVDNKANLNLYNGLEGSVISMTIKTKNLAIFKYLLKNGAILDRPDLVRARQLPTFSDYLKTIGR